MNEYLSVINPDPDNPNAIIMIPDIWGLTDYSEQTAQSFATDYARPCYILDYFYQLTSKPSRFDPNRDGHIAPALMDKMTGEDFMTIFKKAVEQIKKNQPGLNAIQVIGFCFGGRLAYLAGLEESVNKIVSFYGAKAAMSDYYDGTSAVGALCDERGGDSSLKVLSFYGKNDESIPENDRATTQQLFAEANIAYQSFEYAAGHAYFQKGRPNYDASSAEQSKLQLNRFMQ